MRSKYETRALVLARTHAGEANTFVTLLTSDLGLIHARAQSLRKPGAKLAHALPTLAESDVVLVRGKEGWRLAGAVLAENWFQKLQSPDTRAPRATESLGLAAAARVSGLLLRLVAGEVQDAEIFTIIKAFLNALAELPSDRCELAEILAVIRVLYVLGLDSGDLPGCATDFTLPTLAAVQGERRSYVARINTGIAASGL